MLEYAYTLYLDSTCDVCGGSRYECRNEANAGLYEIQDSTCYRQAAVEEHTGQKGFKPEPGQRFYATEIDGDLVTRRTFAPLAGADDQDDQPSERNKRSEAV